MSTWLSLARSAPGVMVEILRHPERTVCRYAGHDWSWSTGALACRTCRWAPHGVSDLILDELDTLEGHAMVAKALLP